MYQINLTVESCDNNLMTRKAFLIDICGFILNKKTWTLYCSTGHYNWNSNSNIRASKWGIYSNHSLCKCNNIHEATFSMIEYILIFKWLYHVPNMSLSYIYKSNIITNLILRNKAWVCCEFVLTFTCEEKIWIQWKTFIGLDHISLTYPWKHMIKLNICVSCV